MTLPNTHARHLCSRALTAALVFALAAPFASAQSTATWRYYRPGNTGIQGDFNEAIHIGADGDPWISGYDPLFEEGGVAQLVQSTNQWVNVSNVDYPAFGDPNDLGASRVSDIVEDAQGNLWLGTWRGAVRFHPGLGPSSIVRFGTANSTLPGGRTVDVEVAPDGSLFFAADSVSWGGGGLARYQPATDTWSFLGGYGGMIASQPRPGGGFYLWASIGGAFGGSARWDSTTAVWTSFPTTAGNPRELISKDSVDDAGNMWILRSVNGFDSALNCMRPDGTWINPPLPPLPASVPMIVAVRAYGTSHALLIDAFGLLHRFNGATWSNLGAAPVQGSVDDLDIDAAGNVWMCGTGGANRRDVISGAWQRYRVTNTCQFDSFVNDLALDDQGVVWATGNAASGVGGFQRFDGTRWYAFNNLTYGLGGNFPFPSDNTQVVATRAANQRVALNPTFWGIHEWDGAQYTTLQSGTSSKDMVEDSLGRLWSLNEYFSLEHGTGTTWTQVPIVGWGANLQVDPSRAGTVWACTESELVRTDGAYRVSYSPGSFHSLDPNIMGFSTVAAGPNGVAWVGVGTGLVRVDANLGTATFHASLGGLSCVGASPRAVTPDGRIWFVVADPIGTGPHGLAWWDGAQAGLFDTPRDGSAQWGGLPHTSISALEVRPVHGGYELWMSCMSRGIAVLMIHGPEVGTIFCVGDGGSAACPCGNVAAAGSQTGCGNSTGVGASLRATGSSSVAADDLTLEVAGLPPQASGLVFMGGSEVVGVALGDGLRCVSAPLYRFAVRNGGASGAFTYGPGQLQWIRTNHPAAAWVNVGATWRFQCWHRDIGGPCGTGVNLTNALAVLFTP